MVTPHHGKTAEGGRPVVTCEIGGSRLRTILRTLVCVVPAQLNRILKAVVCHAGGLRGLLGMGLGHASACAVNENGVGHSVLC